MAKTEREAMVELVAHEVYDKLEIYREEADSFASYLVKRLVESGSVAAVAAEVES